MTMSSARRVSGGSLLSICMLFSSMSTGCIIHCRAEVNSFGETLSPGQTHFLMLTVSIRWKKCIFVLQQSAKIVALTGLHMFQENTCSTICIGESFRKEHQGRGDEFLLS